MNLFPTPLAELTEKQWDALIFQTHKSLARTLGWRTWHVVRPRGSAAGLPDRICWRDRVIYAELKSSTGSLSPLQIEVLTGLTKGGAECYVWLPSDLDEITRVLAKRWRYVPERGHLTIADRSTDLVWVPNALWTRDGCRHDQRKDVAA